MASGEYLTLEEAANQLGKSVDEVSAMIAGGSLQGLRDGGAWRVRKADIDNLVAETGGEEESKGDTLMSIDADVVFAEDEDEPADSAAETWIAAEAQGVFESAPEGVQEAMRGGEIEPAPLSLSPESDDTSLGAVLEDVEGIDDPLLEEPVIAVDEESGLASLSTPTPTGPSRTQMVTLVEAEAYHPAFTLLLLLGMALLGFTGYVLMAGAIGASVEFVKQIQENAAICTGVLFLVVVVIVIIGIAMDKQRKKREALALLNK